MRIEQQAHYWPSSASGRTFGSPEVRFFWLAHGGGLEIDHPADVSLIEAARTLKENAGERSGSSGEARNMVGLRPLSQPSDRAKDLFANRGLSATLFCPHSDRIVLVMRHSRLRTLTPATGVIV